MKTLLFVIIALFTQNTFAQDAASQLLMNAISVCPQGTNPLTELKNIGANSFTNVEFFRGMNDTVELDAIWNPQLLNPMLMSPTILRGKMLVSMTYPAPGYGLVCKVSVSN